MERNAKSVIKKLKAMSNPKAVQGMARFGINPKNNLGLSVVQLRAIAKSLGHSHPLSLELWDSGLHDARILAALIEEPAKMTEDQMDQWARDFDSWDICDLCCIHLFDQAPEVYKKARQWSRAREEFVKRAGFSLMAVLSVHDKKKPDSVFEAFLPRIVKESRDERNYVKKSVNWALRQIGKRNLYLNQKAIATARLIHLQDNKTSRWIASDALRELTSEAVQARLSNK